jgi:hypothetical protein
MRHKKGENILRRQSEDIEWRARIFADNTLKIEVQKGIQKLALVLLGNHKLKIEYSKDGFETKHQRTMHYRGSWREWMVFGRTKTDVYLEVLRMLANDDSTYYPIVSYRQDHEWIEVEEYKKLNEKFEQMKEKVMTGLGVSKEALYKND